MGLISAVFLLGVLIFIHELGHFLLAKYTGVLVERFSIGFGPVLFKWKRGETEYALSAIPLGGYVKMYGEQPDEEVDETKAHRAFNNKTVFQRFLIVFAGPFFNFVLAMIIYAAIFMHGTPRYLAEVGGVSEGSAAAKAGLLQGDMIISVDGRSVKYWEDMSGYVQGRAGQPVLLGIDRGGRLMELTITPQSVTDKNIFGEDVKVGRMGVIRGQKSETVRLAPHEAVVEGVTQTYNISVMMVTGVVKLFQKVVPADSVGGPIMIVQMAKESAETGLVAFFGFMALISINLGILNLLPIPVLDGGHILFLMVEAVTRRAVSIRVREIANMAGMALLMGLMFFAFYNDIMRFFK
ncbi:RIP metalloprotease RseP [Seleniivibrio woodruffii]|uniref:Zinc metalloprotease n=1 Tax=Seleniivibrio woodruffii TaxID=1078050 RepID=A0A4R1KEJ1_9BACT|nr:RIP metalloprotease RseP [Seleniivibrio woodruffii]TCK62413.1 site-2 protease [Seleniivibrio woodruffii]TVZ34469.1 site-2 protease [Seleniivibrio woodruffii]